MMKPLYQRKTLIRFLAAACVGVALWRIIIAIAYLRLPHHQPIDRTIHSAHIDTTVTM